MRREEFTMKIVFRDSVWRIACVNRPQILWIVERKGITVATIRWNDDAIYWIQPEFIEIASSPTAWKTFTFGVQTSIWRRLLAFLQGQEPIVHDRPEIRRLAECTFRIRVDRAIQQGNRDLLIELAQDCPFLAMSRDELLQQQPYELLQWFRLLRLPKTKILLPEIRLFTRSLWHAAGLLKATEKPDE
jgi:hypothetical protein